MPITAATARTAPDDVAAVAHGVASGDALDGALEALGVAPTFARGEGFEGNATEVRALPDGDGTTRYLVGLGPADKLDTEALRRAAGSVARAASRHESLAVDFLGALPDSVDRSAAAGAIAEGVALGAYKFTALKSDPKPSELSHVVVVGPTGKRADASIERGLAVAESVNTARDLVNEPGGSLTPIKLAAAAERLGREAGFEVEVWDEKRIKAERLGGLMGVNRGSAQKPRFLALRYEAGQAEGHRGSRRQGHHV